MRSTFIGLICLLPILSFAQPKGGYLQLSIAPHMNFTTMAGSFVGYSKAAKPGMGYNAQLGYGYQFGSGFWTEVGLGYYRLRKSIDATFLDMHLKPDELSHNQDFLQAVLAIGYSIPVKKAGISISPFIGVRYVYYLPKDMAMAGAWRYTDLTLYPYNDIYAARYMVTPTGGVTSAPLIEYGVKAGYRISRQLRFTCAIYFDMGFVSLSSDGYISEQKFNNHPDLVTQATATNNGNAIGLLLGLHYSLKKNKQH